MTLPISEFRIFCMGAFLGNGAFAGATNHGIGGFVPGNPYLQLLSVGFLCGCIAVVIFGRRAAQ